MSKPTLYRIDYTRDKSDGAWVRAHTESLVALGVLVPVESDDVMKEAILLLESILPTDYGWEETAGLRSALGIGGDEDE